MIKIIFINLFLFSMLFAQDSGGVFRFGLKAGLNFSYISGEYSSSYDSHSKLGDNFGIILNNKINDNNSIQFEILYNHVGSKFGQPFLGIGYDGDYAIYDLKYLSIFGYTKLKSRIGNLLKDFDFVIGIAYSYNISAKQEWIVETDGYSIETGPDDIRSEINHHELAYILGLKIPFKNRKFYLSLLFYNALNSLYPNSYPLYEYDFYGKDEMRNHTISLSFDYFIL